MRSRAAASVLSALAVLLAVAAWPASRALVAPSSAPGRGTRPQSVTSAALGLSATYTTGAGDTWFNTWGANGDIFATSNDTTAFNGKCDSDIAVNELAGDNPTDLTTPFINCMGSFGTSSDSRQDPDGCTWKSGGIISASGTLYLTVARQSTGGDCKDESDGEQPSLDASIVKSTDDGRTWSNGFGTADSAAGAAPPVDTATGHVMAMFPGQDFSAPFFINYGQDDNPASTADGGDQYVYAVSNDGYAYDGSYLYLGRVLRSQIGSLDAADWQYYDGPPGGDGLGSSDWTSSFSDANPVLTATHQISQPDIQYYPSLHSYILTSTYFPFSSSWPDNGAAHTSSYDFFEAPHPWGPWTRFLTRPSTLTVCYLTCQAVNTVPLGGYDVAQVSKFARIDGLSDEVFTEGDFTDRTRYDEPDLYALHVLPLTLSSASYRVTDDSSPTVTYTGSWSASSPIYNGTAAQDDYFDDTYHQASTAGSSVSFTFTGSSVQWIGSTGDSNGIASVSVDGAAAVSVDTYSAQQADQQVLFSSGGLAPGKHTITITVTSGKDPASAGTYQDIDAFVTAPPPS